MMATASPPLSHCIYCDEDVPTAEFTDEHIWPDALGGDALPKFWRTKVCGRCNSLSGIYVDGAFIKSWIGQAERASDTEQYLSLGEPEKAAIPFSFLGSTDEKAPAGEIIDLWAGHCASHVVHFRPANETALFDRYAGGDPRKRGKPKTAGRAYLAIGSPEPFWQKVAIASFARQFRKIPKVLITRTDSSVPHDLPLPDPANPEHIADVPIVRTLLGCEKLSVSIPLDAALGGRFQAKLGLALGYALFGAAFGATPYARALRSAFREADPAKLRSSPVRGSGILSNASLGGTERILRWEGGWVLWLKRQNAQVLLTVIAPSGNTFAITVTDDAKLAATLERQYDEGLCWVVVPAIDEAVGPMWFPDYVAHQLREIENLQLAVLEARKTDRAQLPGCGF